VTARKLRERGVDKLTDVRAADPAMLRDAVGSVADWLQELARGRDERPVVAEHEPKSSGSENTFERDLTDLSVIREEISEMAGHAAHWLARRELFARTVTIKVRYHDFTTITRSQSEAPTRDEENIRRRAVALLDKTEAGRRPIRLLGVSVHNLSEDVNTVEARRPPGPQGRLPFED
jgi:DNA polymerase-4